MTGYIDLSQIPEDRQTEELCLLAVQQNPYNLQHAAIQTVEMCLLAVNKNGFTLEFVKNQTEEICLAAVSSNFNALSFVKNQTYSICSAAINQHADALMYVIEQTPEICRLALSKSASTLQLVDVKLEGVFLDAVKNEPSHIYYIKNISDDILITSLFYNSKLNGIFLSCILKKELVKLGKIAEIAYKEIIGGDIILNKFVTDPRKFCIDVLIEQGDDYIVNLRNKIPDVFDSSEELTSIYERIILNRNINYKINRKLSYKNKKF